MTITADRSNFGACTMALAAAVGLIFASYGYLARGTGIDHTAGALLVSVSSALILLASLVLALFGSAPRWLRGVLLTLLFFGILGTGLASYFLESYALLAAMVLALLGWLIPILSTPERRPTSRLSVSQGRA